MIQKLAGSMYRMTGNDIAAGLGTEISGGMIELVDNFNKPLGIFLATLEKGKSPIFLPTTNTASKNLTESSRAPFVTDDDTQGFSTGSVWIDKARNESYVCSDATAGAALWLQTSIGSIAEIGGLQTALDDKISASSFSKVFVRAVPNFSAATSVTNLGTYEVNASSQGLTSRQAWRAMQSSFGPLEGEWVVDNRQIDMWISVTFPVPTVINRLMLVGRISSNGIMLGGWRFEGSQDSQNWTTLMTNPDAVDGIPRFHDFANTTPYRTYRAFFPKASAGQSGLAAFWLFRSHFVPLTIRV